jgi:DNA ligase-3
MEHKVQDVREFIPKATKAHSIILDGEILLMDTQTHNPLPFGTLGVHKKAAFASATVCVFVFDILFLEGVSLLDKPLEQRRKILEKSIQVCFQISLAHLLSGDSKPSGVIGVS